MNTKRQELRRLTHMLRGYLEEQRHIGVTGLTRAPEDERAAWDAQKGAREAARLERIKNALHGDPAPSRSARPPAPARPPEQAAPARAASAPADHDAPASTRASGKPGPSFLEMEKERKSKPMAQPDISSGDGGALWKQFGSRPSQLFKEKPAATPSDSSKPSRERSERREEEAPREHASPRAGARTERDQQQPPPTEKSSDTKFTEVMRKGTANATVTAASSPFEDAWDESKDPTRTAQPMAGFDGTPAQKRRLSSMDSAEKLGFLRDCLGDCTRCKLSKGRKNIVFGEGSPTADLVFVGEGPGFNEDRTGRPFVGNAGKLLDKMIKAMGLSREQVYICNVVKCRPPNNRDPEPDEIAQCGPFLYKQIETLQPRAIVTLGKFAGQKFLDTDQSMGRMRGRWHDWRGIPVMPTYHPAYLLRREQEGDRTGKRKTWEDLQMVMKNLGLDGK